MLNLLVKKGVLSEKEAQDLTAEEQKDYNTTTASKISLASSIKTIQFYGDLRLRYEMRDGTTSAGATGTGGALLNHGDSETMNRWRYRLRFGVKGDLYDNFFWGIRAVTNPTYDRSGNVTFGHSDAAGPFGKGQSLLALDEVYLGWHATSDITLTGGQMPNPLYTTNLIWDDNINPAGATEEWDHVFDNNVEVFVTAGQYVYQAGNGNGITNTVGSSENFSNTFMYAEQAGFKYNFDKNTFFKAAATFYTYSGTVGTSGTTVASLYSSSPLNFSAPNASPSFFNGPFVGAASAPGSNVSGINNLAVLEIPMEFDFKLGKLPMRVFGDFAYNTEANERADAARGAILNAESFNTVGSTKFGNTGVTLVSTPATGGLTAANVAANNQMFNSPTFQGVLDSGKVLLDQTAYQVGVEAGQLKKKGDWDGKVWWQSTGYYAVDPNLIDADIFNAATNLQGVVVAVSHNWTDGLSSTLRYAYATPVNGKLATPNVNQDLQLGDIREYNLFQADLMLKF
ncbi:MAG: putative porin [Methylacidiphilales bacterium]|nr:putative porin [Candidatus Methylacidiphilales bacterium]